MPRPEKVQAVAEIKQQIESAQAVFLTEYRGIAVQKMSDLRRRLRDAGAEYKVVKMTLARRAADDLGIEGLDEHLAGPTAMAFAHADAVAVAKALSDFSKENEALVIKLGLLADRVLQPEEVSRLAAIEPREVLLAKVAGAARAPLYALAGMLASFTRDAAGLFSALLEKKEASDPTGTEVAGAGSPESADSPDSPDSPDSADSPDSPESADSPDGADRSDEPQVSAETDDQDDAEDPDGASDDPAEEE